MKYVVLERKDAKTWEHVGAFEGEVAEHANKTDAQAAIEQVGRAGVFVAIPFADWIVFEAEAQVTVRPVTRREPGDVRGTSWLADQEIDQPSVAEAMLDPDMEGMTQGPKQR